MLKKRYEADTEFAVLLKMLPSLAFVPEEKVDENFNQLINTIDFPEETQSVVDYFERTYIGRHDRNKPPLFYGIVIVL